jgi:hypothetical protein
MIYNIHTAQRNASPRQGVDEHLQGKELMIISSPYGKTSIFPQMLLKSSPMEAWKNFQ